MSRFLKVTSVSGGIGTIAGITGIAVLASQTPGETVLATTEAPIIETPRETVLTVVPTPAKAETKTIIKAVGETENKDYFGLDIDREKVERYFFRKNKDKFFKYMKDKKENKDLKATNKQLQETNKTLNTTKQKLEAKIKELEGKQQRLEKR